MPSEILDRRSNAEMSSEDRRAECEEIRRRIQLRFRSAVEQDGVVLTEKVMDLSVRDIKDKKLEEYGYKDTESKRMILLQNEQDTIKTIHEASLFRQQLQSALAGAHGVLKSAEVDRLKTALSRHNGSWILVQQFFRNDSDDEKTLQGLRKIWAKIGEKTKEVERRTARLKREQGALPELSALAENQKSGSLKERLPLLDAALQALTALEHGKDATYAKARAVMQPAVQAGVMTAGQMERNLVRIFGKYSGKALHAYVTQTLPSRIRDWKADVQRFRVLAKEGEKAGVQMITEEEFFQKNYSERRAELVSMRAAIKQGAEPAPNPILAAIQRKIDTQDRKAVTSLLKKAGEMDLSAQDRRKLTGMELHWNSKEKASSKKTDPRKKAELDYRQKYSDMEVSLHTFGTVPTQKLVRRFIKRGGMEEGKRLYALNKGIGNVNWGVEHNWLDKQKIHNLRQSAERDTKVIQERGHKKQGAENIDLSVKESATQKDTTLRSYEKGEKGLTIYHFGEHDLDKVERDIDHRKDNFMHNYWFDLVDKNATLEQIVNYSLFVAPKIKAYSQAKAKARQAGVKVDSMPLDCGTPAPTETPLQMAG